MKTSDFPNNIEAEQAVLAACLLNEDACDEITAQLTPESFFRVAHSRIFTAILNMVKAGMKVDAITLADKLYVEGSLESVGGRAYISDINYSSHALASWRQHLQIVKRTHLQRELMKASVEIGALAMDSPEDPVAVAALAEQTLFSVTESSVPSSFQGMDSLMNETYEHLSRISKSDGGMVGVPSGLKDLDDVLHGFRDGNLIVIGARPSIGKTALGVKIATEAAKSGAVVVFFSLEMNALEISMRMLNAEAGVDLSNLTQGKVRDKDWGALADAASRLSILDMRIDSTEELTLMQIRAKARRELRKVAGTDKKALIVVDYLQYITPAPAGYRDTRAM